MDPTIQRMRAHAAALNRQGRRADAIALYRQSLDLQPAADGEPWYEFGYMLKADGRYEDALVAYSNAIERGISRAEEVHLNRAVIYSDHLRRDADAERELRAALDLAPAYVPALLNFGNLHEERGAGDSALACYARILALDEAGLDPEHRQLRLEALSRTVKLRRPTRADDPLLEQLNAAASLPAVPMVRANVLFSLGECYDRIGEYDHAFDAFARANRWLTRGSGRLYDRARAERATDELIQVFSEPAPGAGAPDDGPAPRPLFICGMFRSGSTLIEQVLASYPEVHAGGEVNYLWRLVVEQLAPFPNSVATADASRDARLAEGYRAHLLRLFPDAAGRKFITDKRPDNFLLVGLIKRMFPTARIIHTRRSPLDVGLSVFTNHLHLQVAPYSADLGDIGHYYGQYERLMRHWKSLYPDSILDFDYDSFVADPQPSLERLLAFLDFDWSDRGLGFHTLSNTVKTASYWQVRQPLHGKASGRWRNYAAHLVPLRRALQEAGVDVPDGRAATE